MFCESVSAPGVFESQFPFVSANFKVMLRSKGVVTLSGVPWLTCQLFHCFRWQARRKSPFQPNKKIFECWVSFQVLLSWIPGRMYACQWIDKNQLSFVFNILICTGALSIAAVFIYPLRVSPFLFSQTFARLASYYSYSHEFCHNFVALLKGIYLGLPNAFPCNAWKSSAFRLLHW